MKHITKEQALEVADASGLWGCEFSEFEDRLCGFADAAIQRYLDQRKLEAEGVSKLKRRPMTVPQHAKILSAYISRLTLSDLEDVCLKQWDAHAASLNYGTALQIKKQKTAYSAIEGAVARLIKHDRRLIAGVIEAEMSS